MVGSVWTQLGGDIDGELAGDQSGTSVSLSSNGLTVAIGARYNDGNGTNSGHVRVYQYVGSVWTQLGGDIDGELASDQSGYSVSLSSNGLTVAIGARYNDGNGTDSGHVRVYEMVGSVWTQLGGDIDGELTNDQSGTSVSLSSDGLTVAIGAYGNDGNGTNSGHVRVYQYVGSVWTQMSIDIDGELTSDQSGYSVSLSSDGLTVAIGANGNDGNGADSGHVRVYEMVPVTSSGGSGGGGGSGPVIGKAYVYTESAGSWTLDQTLSSSTSTDLEKFGFSSSLSGSQMVIGAPGYDSNKGRVYLFENSGSWSETLFLDGHASSPLIMNDSFGYSVSMSGIWLCIGSPNHSSSASGSGGVFVYELVGGLWTFHTLLSPDIYLNAKFGTSVSVDTNGTPRITVGAPNQGSGRVYVFEYSSITWTKTQRIQPPSGLAGDCFGSSLSMFGDSMVISSLEKLVSGSQSAGAAYTYVYNQTQTQNQWVISQTLTSPIPGPNYLFGRSVSMDELTMCVGENQSSLEPLSNTTDFQVTVAPKVSHPLTGTGSSNGFIIDGVEGETLTLVLGVTYTFTLDSSVSTHPFVFTTETNGTGGSSIDGFPTPLTDSGTVTFTPTETTPSSFSYQCGNHSYMGGTVTIVEPYEAKVVHVYTRETVTDQWSLFDTLSGLGGSNLKNAVGTCVSVSGTHILTTGVSNTVTGDSAEYAYNWTMTDIVPDITLKDVVTTGGDSSETRMDLVISGDGTRMVVGNESEGAYGTLRVYEKVPGSGSDYSWGTQANLTITNTTDPKLGSDVCMNGDGTVLACVGNQTGGSSKVYVSTLSGSWGALTDITGLTSFEGVGNIHMSSNGLFLVCSGVNPTGTGGQHSYVRVLENTGSWIYRNGQDNGLDSAGYLSVDSSTGQAHHALGISDDGSRTLFVSNGHAYVYSYNGTRYVEEQQITTSYHETYGVNGCMNGNGDLLVMRASYSDYEVWERLGGGTAWTLTQTVRSENPVVRMNRTGSTIVFGNSNYRSSQSTGSIQIMVKDQTGKWTLGKHVPVSDLSQSASTSNTGFGYSVSVSDTSPKTIVVRNDLTGSTDNQVWSYTLG
jgi:hypothetical protein